jgi:predicted RNase H-like HicB family nuclease
MTTRSFTVILHREDDMYIAECPKVGTVDQGRTIEEAIVLAYSSLRDKPNC